MKHSLYLKFILTYLVFGLLGFLVIATFSSHMTLNYLTGQRAESLYREANYISTNFARSYYSESPNAASLEDIHSHFQALDTYLNASIWLLNADGTLLVNSDTSLSEGTETVIEDFDPTDMGSSYYVIGDFYSRFDEETLSVVTPITYNFRTRGYVLNPYAHAPAHRRAGRTAECDLPDSSVYLRPVAYDTGRFYRHRLQAPEKKSQKRPVSTPREIFSTSWKSMAKMKSDSWPPR